MTATANISIKGHVHIQDRTTGEVLLDKNNAVHNKNMAIALARGLANDPNHQIYRIKLGNGGSSIDSMNMITYLPPNVVGASADLYNETYDEIVDDADITAPAENEVSMQESSDPDETALVIVTATIAAGEPSGQDLTDSSPDPNNQFAFDELGLFTVDDRLLSHIIFSPILKTANRELVITYTLTIAVE
jgi:hypothetical protein